MPPKGMLYLKNKLVRKRTRVLLRYRYYDMKKSMEYVKTIIPGEFTWMAESLGWCGKAVDSLADRLYFRGFRNDNFDLNTIFRMNNMDILPDSSFLSALISSCSFIYISEDVSGFPRMEVISGADATGEIDTATYLLTEGYAVLERDENGKAVLEAYFTPGKTEYYTNGELIRIDTNRAPAPLLVPIIYRPDAIRPFGHSRISRACMKLTQGALRTLFRSEVSAEFYSFPQKWVSGLSDSVEEFDKWKASIATLLVFTKDDEGEAPKIGQFSQQSMQPYIDQLRTFASLFAGETGLTPDDLGFVKDNPSSSEAIKASHENLRLLARKAQRTFGAGLLNAGYLAACVRDNYPYTRQQLYETTPAWNPIFEPDAHTIAAIGDAAVKMNQACPGYIGASALHDITGIEPDSRQGAL